MDTNLKEIFSVALIVVACGIIFVLSMAPAMYWIGMWYRHWNLL